MQLLMVLSVGFIVASTGTIVLNTVLDDKPPQPGSSAEQSVLAQALQVVELMSIGARFFCSALLDLCPASSARHKIQEWSRS